MSLGLFTHCAGGCGAELVGGPGLCVPCAMKANGGALPCSTCNGEGCDVCAFSGTAAPVDWDYTTWPENTDTGWRYSHFARCEVPPMREGAALDAWLDELKEAHTQGVIAEQKARGARRRAKEAE